MVSPNQYGARYWCVCRDDERIYIHADEVSVCPDGTLVLRNAKHVCAAFAQGMWGAVYAASLIDGRPVAAEHWPSELTDG